MKKHRNWNKRIDILKDGFVHKVSIPWQNQKEYWWNETCADVVEVFGLPGDRFVSHPQMNQMDFYFKSNKDAELCRILLSDKIMM
jgi:hypothetical protein